MTEKRFTYTEQFNGFCDVYDNGKVLSCMRLEYVQNTVNLLNEQEETIQRLKMTMKGVAELLSIDADLFSDKATEHDMNAYIELKEFDNKDVYLMAVSIKKAIKMLKGDVDES